MSAGLKIFFCKKCQKYYSSEIERAHTRHEHYELSSSDVVYYLNRLRETRDAYWKLKGLMES